MALNDRSDSLRTATNGRLEVRRPKAAYSPEDVCVIDARHRKREDIAPKIRVN